MDKIAFEVDRRLVKHCKECKQTNLYFKVNPLPIIKDLTIICADCGHEIQANRENDIHEFKKECQEFNS